MSRLVLYILSVGIAMGAAGCHDNAHQKPAAEVVTAVPPIIDRELFFGDPEISASQISPDGAFISFVRPYQGVRNIWVKKTDEPFDAARPLTADKRPVTGYFWSRDSHAVLYVQDMNGDENFHVWAVDPSASNDQATGVPTARDLTPLAGVRAYIYSLPRNAPDALIVGINDRDPSFHDVYKVRISDGARSLLLLNDKQVGGWTFDEDGNVRLAERQLPDGGTELMRVNLDGDLEQIATCTYEETLGAVSFHADGRHCYVTTNRGEADLEQLMLLDVETGVMQLVESDPDREVDFGGTLFHPDTHELLATFYAGDRVRVYPKTADASSLYEDLKKNLPDGEISLTSVTLDLSKVLAAVTSDVDPGSVYLYDRKTGKATLQYRSRPDLPSEHLAAMRPVRYQGRDGMTLHGYLTVPRGVEAKKLPVVMYIHGGPWARDYWGYDPYAQFLANRGYAVMQVNYRGSTGYGKAYTNAGNKEWGIGAMQHDITDAVTWLIDQGLADPARVGIFGGSYGGYATLAGVTFTPDVYACGIPYVGPSNLLTLINSFPEYWKPFLEGSWYKRVGNPAIEADRVDLMARSPLFHCDQIQAPLLVVHGANDPRVTQHESDQIVAALRDKGKAVEYLVAPDEGHGFRAPNNRMAMAVAMERFLAKQLGGRVQPDVAPQTQKRLDEITIDPKTVTLPAEVD
jgi:dipeptidyl aminopeptidase/acylaminoacyl peptidase